MQKTQNLLFKNLSNISHGLNKNIISKGPLSKLEEKIIKLETIKKENSNKFKILEESKQNVVKKFHIYDKLFNSYLPEVSMKNNANNNIRRPSLMDTPDFINIMKSLMQLINKLISDINLFIVETKDSFNKINQLYVEMSNLVKNSVLIYIQETKKVFNIDVTKNFEEIEKYYKKLEKDKEDKLFKLNKIFHNSQSLENMHSILQQYYVLLCNTGRVKKELLLDRNKFSIDQNSNILAFFEWLISVSPQQTGLSFEDLVIQRIKLKRDPGVFSGWRDIVMIFTRQHHLLLYDYTEKVENYNKIFELDKTSFRKKLDSKKPFLFEIIAYRKGKLMDFKGNYLFDDLKEENINIIHSLMINPYNI